MLTRGIIIGKIIDDLATLKYQIELRNKLGLFDLTKICEDFCKELLNATYGYNLRNLNIIRSNEPGIDLGDDAKQIAFQVTSQRTTAKINATLSKITDEQKGKYDTIKILILGKRQSTYSIDRSLSQKFRFKEKTNIIDIDVILREIVFLDIDQLEAIYRLFVREFRQMKIELEPIDSDGCFDSSYYNFIEKKPALPPKNGRKFLDVPEENYEEDFHDLLNLYQDLASVPRVTRELLAIIVDKGTNDSRYQIIIKTLERLLRIDTDELKSEIDILEDAGLAEIGHKSVGERDVFTVRIGSELLNDLFKWMIDEKIPIRATLNTLDFSVFDD